MDVGAHDADDARIAEPMETYLARPKSLLGLSMCKSLLGLTHLALDRRRQPAELVLENVVVRSGAHRLHSGLFTDRSRHDDEWQVETAFRQDREGGRGGELGHRPIRGDDVPR